MIFFFLKADIFLTAIYAPLCSIFLLSKQYQAVMWLPSRNSLSDVVEPPMCRRVIYVNIHITPILQQEVQLQDV